MATQNRAPTGDGTVTGTVTGTAGSRFTLVDDYPSTDSADMLTFGTATSAINFTYSAFTVPTGSVALSVQVRYADGEASSGNNNCGGRLVVNGANQNAATHNPSTTATLRSDNWATNPVTASAWTVDQVNGSGSNALSGFGINSSDSNPTFNIRSIEVQVTYTPPVTGDLSGTLGSLTASATALLGIRADSSGTLEALTAGSTGTVIWPPLAGDSSVTLGALTVTSTGSLLQLEGDLSAVLAALEVAATGTLQTAGISADLGAALEALVSSATGTLLSNLEGDLSTTLGNVSLSSAGVLLGELDGDLAVALGELLLDSSSGLFSPVTASVTRTLGSLACSSLGLYGVPRERLTKVIFESIQRLGRRQRRTRI